MLIGQANLMGNVEPGYAVLEPQTGHTLYKMSYNGPAGKNALNVDRMEWVKIPNDKPVWVLSLRISNVIKEEILRTPGFRGLIIP